MTIPNNYVFTVSASFPHSSTIISYTFPYGKINDTILAISAYRELASHKEIKKVELNKLNTLTNESTTLRSTTRL